MHSFSYKNGYLHCEGVNLETIAAEEGSPVYVYSKETILDHFRRLKEGMSALDVQIEYAVKACSNIAILSLIAKEGAGFDIVSGGELYRVIKAGGNPARCTYAGVGKTEPEIRYALEHGIYCFNVESEAEMWTINNIAGDMGVKAPVAVRVNPNVEAGTHKYITTGTSENKFGIDFEDVEALYAKAARQMPHIQLKGLQMHIGSQLTKVTPFVEAVNKMSPMAATLKALYGIEFFSIGGGVGIVYDGSLISGSDDWWRNDMDQITIDAYSRALAPMLKPLGLKILLEPGRLIVGNAGCLVSQCLYEKTGKSKTFKIIDAGMNDLIRPALYEGYHEIVPVKEHAGEPLITADIVGPICESGDFLAQDREIADIKPGEHIAALSAGAYGFSMSSNYNSRPMAAEVLVDGNSWKVIRRRQTWVDLIDGETLV